MARRNRKTRTHRKGTRRNSRTRRNMRGGQVGSPVNNTGIENAGKINLLQGQEYGSQHANQHGGEAPFDGSSDFTGVLPKDMQGQARVPVMSGGVAEFGNESQFSGVLDPSLNASARITPTLQAQAEIIGMKDQGGGRRRHRHRRGRRSGRKSRRSGRKSRRCWKGTGGSASVNDPTVLLPVDMEKQAVMNMNPEWKFVNSPDLKN